MKMNDRNAVDILNFFIGPFPWGMARMVYCLFPIPDPFTHHIWQDLKKTLPATLCRYYLEDAFSLYPEARGDSIQNFRQHHPLVYGDLP